MFAQRLTLPGHGGGVSIQGPAEYSGGETLGQVISNIYPLLFVLAGIGLLLMLIFGGFQLLTGGTDPKRIEMGKQRITFAIVGFLIVFFAFWMVQFIGTIFNLTEFKSIFGPR